MPSVLFTVSHIRRWRSELEQRGLVPNLTSELARIYAAELTGFLQLSDSLSKILLDSCPTFAKQVRSAALQAAAAAGNLERMRLHMKKFETAEGQLEMPVETLFAAIWALAKKDPEGTQTMALIGEVRYEDNCWFLWIDP